MTSLRQLSNRIHSVQATQKLTASMKVVALSRLKKKHALFLDAVPYADEMNRVMRRLVRSLKSRENPKKQIPKMIQGIKDPKRYLLVPITSDEGLSGSSSLQILKQTEKVVEYLKEEQKEVRIFAFGSRGGEAIKRQYPDITEIESIKQQNNPYLRAAALTDRVFNSFHQGMYDVCLVIFQRFHSIVKQTPYIEQMIPMMTFLRENPWEFLVLEEENNQLKKSSFLSAIGGANVLPSLNQIIYKTNLEGGKRPVFEYDYEPSDKTILEQITVQYLTAYIYRVILESEVSDNAARLMAMDNATRNAGDMIEQLTKEYRQERQTRITTDIAEVSAGATQEKKK